jgi:hypothetical protein
MPPIVPPRGSVCLYPSVSLNSIYSVVFTKVVGAGYHSVYAAIALCGARGRNRTGTGLLPRDFHTKLQLSLLRFW